MLPHLHQRFLGKKYVAQQNFCSRVLLDIREQAPGANLLHDSVSRASSLVCTEIFFAGVCFRSKLPRVYWLEYLPGSVFEGQAPSCVLVVSPSKGNQETTGGKEKIF